MNKFLHQNRYSNLYILLARDWNFEIGKRDYFDDDDFYERQNNSRKVINQAAINKTYSENKKTSPWREKRETDSEELFYLKKTIRKLINKSRLYEAAKISIKKEENDFEEKKRSPTSKDYLKERNWFEF